MKVESKAVAEVLRIAMSTPELARLANELVGTDCDPRYTDEQVAVAEEILLALVVVAPDAVSHAQL